MHVTKEWNGKMLELIKTHKRLERTDIRPIGDKTGHSTGCADDLCLHVHMCGSVMNIGDDDDSVTERHEDKDGLGIMEKWMTMATTTKRNMDSSHITWS